MADGLRRVLFAAATLFLSTCAGSDWAVRGMRPLPVGNNIQGDIDRFAYQNQPRPPQSAGQLLEFSAGTGGATIASSDIPWRVPLACRESYRKWMETAHPGPVADQESGIRAVCADKTPKDAFLGVAITGGGNKSAVYATEVLFELQRYGLAENIDVISSVSGGSFAALLYGLSCDHDSNNCRTMDGWTRPAWDYLSIRRWMETNYFWPFVGHRFRPDNLFYNIFEFHGSDDDMAAIVSSRLLHENGRDLTFKDLNPARPNLILNATNVTRSRPDFDLNSFISPDDKRPLTDDDALHFAFTQQYFWRLMSDLDLYPLKEALVASAAFPLIIDRVSLRQYRAIDLPMGSTPNLTPRYVSLYDGGVHDNFAVSELTTFLECQLDSLSGTKAPVGEKYYRRQCGREKSAHPRPRSALVLGINSSLLRSEGVDDDVPKKRGFDTYVLPVRISGVEEAVDMIMAASGEQRKQQLRRLIRDANPLDAPTGYASNDPENPELRYGPYQYVDIDLEAAQILYCKPNSKPNNRSRGTIDRYGHYVGDLPDDRLLNAATGGSDASRCDALQGVLRWNRDKGQGGRDLLLPQALPTFCNRQIDCPQLLALIGDRKFMDCNDDPSDAPAHCLKGEIDPSKLFFDPQDVGSPRLLSNRLLFDAVKTVPTDFRLDARYAWLLRYNARWAVAHRIWSLCTFNRPLLETFGPGKASRACDDPLPPRAADDASPHRALNDDVGSAEWIREGL